MGGIGRARIWPLALVVVAGCAESGPVVTVYSPHGREQLVLFEEGFEAANPGVDVQWVDMGSQEVLDRVRSERANPQADVWFGGPEVFFSRAAAEDLLEPYRPAWADAVGPEARGPDDLYFGVYLTPAVITYNSDAVTSAEIHAVSALVVDRMLDQLADVPDRARSRSTPLARFDGLECRGESFCHPRPVVDPARHPHILTGQPFTSLT